MRELVHDPMNTTSTLNRAKWRAGREVHVLEGAWKVSRPSASAAVSGEGTTPSERDDLGRDSCPR